MSWAKLKAAEELAEKSEGIADCYGNPNIGGAEKCGESKGSLVMEDERPYRVAGREPTLAEAMAKLGEAVELLRVIVARGEEKND